MKHLLTPVITAVFLSICTVKESMAQEGISKTMKTYTRPGRIAFIEGKGGATHARLTTGAATADISLMGALVTSYIPGPDQPDVFWMGTYVPGRDRDVWGGIPLCWPWFVQGTDGTKRPFHGFARHSEWTVIGAETPSDELTVLRLELTDSEETRTFWPHAFRAEFRVELGSSLKITLITENTGDEPFELEQAFHTYFRVGDVTKAVIRGLEGTEGKSGDQTFTQEGPLTLNGPYSAVFDGVEGDCTIEDPVWNRTIRIRKSGSRQAVVWNSGPVREVNGRTTGEPGWQTQLTLEQLMGLDDARVIQPGKTAELTAEFIIEL